MRRGSRKKQQDASSTRGEEFQHRSVTTTMVASTVKRQQPPLEVFQHQQRKKKQDEISSLTTKNYRLAKELADLRQRHRDECRNVTRLTMENMNLASRCREAISHVAMLKKELSMQQKRTAQALALQREQNQRMTENLTSSFISSSSGDSPGKNLSISNDNILRLVSKTPSSPERPENFRGTFLKGDPSNQKAESPTDIRPSTPNEELRDSPSNSVSINTKIEMAAFEGSTPPDTISLDFSSTYVNGKSEELMGDAKGMEKVKSIIFHSTTKRNKAKEGSKENLNNNASEPTDKSYSVPFSMSASPKAFLKFDSVYKTDSYDEQFPSDVSNNIETGKKSNDKVNDPHSIIKLNLMNNVDAFDKSFLTQFPDSFAIQNSRSGGKFDKITYNPFFTTPEKSSGNSDSSFSFSETTNNDKLVYHTPQKNGTENSPFDINYVTPPQDECEKGNSGNKADINRVLEEPCQPEKGASLEVHARYEKILGSCKTDVDPVANDDGDATSKPMQFEGTNDRDIPQISTRSSRRRSVKKPISYAEPALNTKLRKGATFFPKMSDEDKETKTSSNAALKKKIEDTDEFCDNIKLPTARMRGELSSTLGTYWENEDDKSIQHCVISPESSMT